MSLPMPWVEKIFKKLTLVYGRDFLSRWEGVSISDVKTDWAHELTGFDANPKAIAHALQNLPIDKPPTVYQFRTIAYKCPSDAVVFIDQPKASAERIAAELLAMVPIRNQPKVDGKEWARRLISRHDAGDMIRPYSLNLAKGALGLAA